MNTLTRNQQWIIAGILLSAMVLTRSHLVNHIQDASWAIFFLVGFYLRSYLMFPIFIFAAFAVDYIVVDLMQGENYCFTPAYPFLIPAYAALWGAGRWFAEHYQENLKGLFSFAASASIGIVICFVISNAGFYWFSEHFSSGSAMQYAQSVSKYLPMYLQTTGLYLAIAAVIHLAITHTNLISRETTES